jgi:predicted CXXCH cytochrome family protein
MRRPSALACIAALLLCSAGCARLVDGWPTMPPAEDYCRVAEQKKQALAASSVAKPAVEAPARPKNSIHSPYEEKRCNGCHDEDKKSLSGLLKPKDELCFSCHPAIMKHAWAHGPTAQGECLACHLPHEASYPFLLSSDPASLCQKCHAEKRLAAAMHGMVGAKGIVCTDCHDPHSGTSHSLLR